MGATCSSERESEKIDIYSTPRLWTTYSLTTRTDRDNAFINSDELWPGALGFDREVIRLGRGCCSCDGGEDQTYGIPDVTVLEDDLDNDRPTITLRGAHDDMWFDDKYDEKNRFATRTIQRIDGRSLRMKREQDSRIRTELPTVHQATMARIRGSADAAAAARARAEAEAARAAAEAKAAEEEEERRRNADPDQGGMSASEKLALLDLAAEQEAAAAAAAAAAEESDGGISPDEPDSPDELLDQLVGARDADDDDDDAYFLEEATPAAATATAAAGEKEETKEEGDTNVEAAAAAGTAAAAVAAAVAAGTGETGGETADDEADTNTTTATAAADGAGAGAGTGPTEGVPSANPLAASIAKNKAAKAAAEAKKNAKKGPRVDPLLEPEPSDADFAAALEASEKNPRSKYRVMVAQLNGMSEREALVYDAQVRAAEREARIAQRRALAASLGMTPAQIVALAAEVREREQKEKLERLLAERAERRRARDEVRRAKQALREAHELELAERRAAKALAEEQARKDREQADYEEQLARMKRIAAGDGITAGQASEVYDFSRITFGVLTDDEKAAIIAKETAEAEAENAEMNKLRRRAERRAERMGLGPEQAAKFIADEYKRIEDERQATKEAKDKDLLHPMLKKLRKDQEAAAAANPAAAAAAAAAKADARATRAAAVSPRSHTSPASPTAATSPTKPSAAAAAAAAVHASPAARAAVEQAERETLAYEESQRAREAAEAKAINELPPADPADVAAAGPGGVTTHVQIAPKGRVDPTKEVIRDGVRLINENELRWWEEKLLSPMSDDWSIFAKEKGRFRIWKAKIAALGLQDADTSTSSLLVFKAEIFVPDVTPLRVFTSLYDLNERMNWDNGFKRNEVTHSFDGHPFNNEIWFTRNEVPLIKSRDFLVLRAYSIYSDLDVLLRHRLTKTAMDDDTAERCMSSARYDSKEAANAEAAGNAPAISYMYRSVDHESLKESTAGVRAWSHGAALLFEVPLPNSGKGGAPVPDIEIAQGRKGTIVHMVSATDPKGSVPSFLVNTAGVSGFKDWLSKFIKHNENKN